MFQNDVFGFGRNNVFGFHHPVLGNCWTTTPYGIVSNQTPWNLGTQVQYPQFPMNTQIPSFYNQHPLLHGQSGWNWNCFQPQTTGQYNQGFLPFFGTNLPYQTQGYFGGINQHSLGQNPIGSINPFVSQLGSTPWGFGSICR
jgi:hypothetical protein